MNGGSGGKSHGEHYKRGTIDGGAFVNYEGPRRARAMKTVTEFPGTLLRQAAEIQSATRATLPEIETPAPADEAAPLARLPL